MRNWFRRNINTTADWLFLGGIVTCASATVAFVIIVIYVIAHFIAKVW